MIDVTTIYAPPSNSMTVFCDAVKARLRVLRISQNELARRTGIPSGRMSIILNGKAGNCSLETCDKIAAELHTTTHDLLAPRQ